VEYTATNSSVFSARGLAVPGYDGAHLALSPDGRLRITTTMPGIGQGSATTFSQIAADVTGIPIESIDVPLTRASVGALKGTGTFASRSAISGGGAVTEAGMELRSRLLADGAARLGAATQDVDVADGYVAVGGDPGRRVAIGELAKADPERYRVTGTFDPPIAYPYATHCCRVEVDPATGAVEIDRYVIAEDCGRLINPTIAEGQVHGATAQGIGGALYESVVYDLDGQPVTGSLMDYLVPTAMEVPEFDVEHLELPAPETPNGAKGVGEGGTLAAPAAVVGAVSDAIGVDLYERPLTPERVAAAVRITQMEAA
jgi:carbon-monoxide dehydrogenase large subunit